MRTKVQCFLIPAALVGALAFVCALPAFGQIKAGTNVNTSKMPSDQNECTIAKNPTNKLQLFILCNNDNAGLFAARSTDGGITWTYPDPSKTIANGITPSLGPAACCDPQLAWDTFGNLFLTYIDSGIQNIVTLLSTDSGLTFSTLAEFGPAGVDQPHVAAAAGQVWIAWTLTSSGDQIVARGAPVTGLGTVGPFVAQQTVPGAAPCDFGDIAISPKGVVVQVCMSPNSGAGPANLLVNTNTGGLTGTFGAAITASSTNVGGWDYIPAQNERSVDAEPSLAYDRNPLSPHYGRLYMAYTDSASVSSPATNIMLRYSDNDGAAWSAAQQVNDDASGRSHFWPRIASNPLSGNIAVCWHDCRNSSTDTAMQEFCTMATPTGSSPIFMPNGQVSEGASTSNGTGVEFGDYAGLAYFQGLAHPVWADTSNSTGDNPNGTSNFDAYTNQVSGGAAAMEGDTHVTTVSGVHYNFQGVGEFVSLRDGDGSEIQTRMTGVATTSIAGPDPYDDIASCVSVNTAVAARVGGHRVTYEPNINGEPDPSGLQLRIDGNLTTLGPNGLELGPGGRIIGTAALGGIEIDLPDGTLLDVTPTWWAAQSKWYLNVDVLSTPSLEGIMGAILPGSWLPLLPDGTSVGPMPATIPERYASLYHKFGDAWRVNDYTSLFDYGSGTSTRTFTQTDWPPVSGECTVPESRPVRPVDLRVAEAACRKVAGKSAHEDCLFDVTATGNEGFAKTYQLSQRIKVDSTTTTVSDDADPTQVGGSVNFTAVVELNTAVGNRMPAGRVRFTVDGVQVGDPIRLNSEGRASWNTSSLREGTHDIVAIYIPAKTSPFLASTSLAKSHVVNCGCKSGRSGR